MNRYELYENGRKVAELKTYGEATTEAIIRHNRTKRTTGQEIRFKIVKK